MNDMVDGWARPLIDTLLPQRCLHCGLPARDLALCAACRSGLPYNRLACPRCAQPQTHDALCAGCVETPPDFDSAWTLMTLHPPVHTDILRLKYAASFLHAEVYARLMADALARRAQPLPDLLIPAPLHWRRLTWRGYNQAGEIARRLSRTLTVEVAHDVAVRTRVTADQIGKTAAERRRNVRGAFRINKNLSGLRVALLDDVITTGATLNELARACRAAGAVRIEAWAVARTP